VGLRRVECAVAGHARLSEILYLFVVRCSLCVVHCGFWNDKIFRRRFIQLRQALLCASNVVTSRLIHCNRTKHENIRVSGVGCKSNGS
jgi:hypothetical protein